MLFHVVSCFRVFFKVLSDDFLPLVNADYSGGVIIYDWYSDKENSKEQIKIAVKFLNNELRADSIQITSHKKICGDDGKCTTKRVDDKFSSDIKDSIITSARSQRIEDSKKEKLSKLKKKAIRNFIV